MLYSPSVKGNVVTNCCVMNTTGSYNTVIGDKTRWRSQKRLGTIQKESS